MRATFIVVAVFLLCLVAGVAVWHWQYAGAQPSANGAGQPAGDTSAVGLRNDSMSQLPRAAVRRYDESTRSWVALPSDQMEHAIRLGLLHTVCSYDSAASSYHMASTTGGGLLRMVHIVDIEVHLQTTNKFDTIPIAATICLETELELTDTAITDRMRSYVTATVPALSPDSVAITDELGTPLPTTLTGVRAETIPALVLPAGIRSIRVRRTPPWEMDVHANLPRGPEPPVHAITDRATVRLICRYLNTARKLPSGAACPFGMGFTLVGADRRMELLLATDGCASLWLPGDKPNFYELPRWAHASLARLLDDAAGPVERQSDSRSPARSQLR